MQLSLKIGRQICQQRPVSVALFSLLALSTALASWLKSSGFHADYVYQLETVVGGDTHLHGLLALFLTLALYRVLSVTSSNYKVVLITGALVAFCCLIDEGMQAFSPLRTFSVLDILASLMGVTIASLINTLLAGLRQRKQRSSE
ncbi:exopolysaccharide biosynthesis protein VpsQ [Vibrio mimicus]|uniref:exopolysaccharide biosynthesis protein VpsQ n=1 Tax=Vibrio mimicus TaxID=674 RepID=UPI0003B1B498|nr:teicoplanin resistance protein VanZ [Vibrio mimicus CAIM 1883]ERM62299.1 teicoplanin resistance protein VanZ [Vibrio mimicus CAIM 1882]